MSISFRELLPNERHDDWIKHLKIQLIRANQEIATTTRAEYYRFAHQHPYPLILVVDSFDYTGSILNYDNHMVDPNTYSPGIVAHLLRKAVIERDHSSKNI